MSRAVVVATRGLLILLTLLLMLAAGWGWVSGDIVWWRLARAWWLFAVAGLVGSFVLHEWGHLCVLRRLPMVSSVAFERHLWRLSVSATGSVSARENALVAVAGPGLCALVALMGWLLEAPAAIIAVYASHVAFVVPPFADGRSLVRSIRVWRAGV